MRSHKPTRRAVIGAGLLAPTAARALPRRTWGGSTTVVAPPQQTIVAVNLSGTTFLGGAGSANMTIGTATAVLSPSSPPPSGITWSINGPDAGLFLIDPSSGILKVGATDQPINTYHINIIATNAAYAGSGTQFGQGISGVSSGLSTNVLLTRPLGVLNFNFPPVNDYPLANVIAAVSRPGANGPANPTDRLQFFNPATQAYVGTPWYLNNSPNPPGSGISSAAGLQVPSVQGTTWNPSGSDPPTPPVLQWELHYVDGATNAVIASQPITIDVLHGRDQAGVEHHARTTVFPYDGGGLADHTRTVFFPHINAGTNFIGGGSNCPIIAGTMIMDTFVSYEAGFSPAVNSIIVQWTIDDIPVGAPIAGPTSLLGGNFWVLNINTATVSWNGGTGIPDGTHTLSLFVLDATGGSFATVSLPYNYRWVPISFIVHNTGTSLATLYASPIRIPTIDNPNAPSVRLNSSKYNFVTFPGFTAIASGGGTNGTHNTVVPIPLPQSGFIPPASDPSSPFFSLTADQMHDPSRLVVESLPGATAQEYISFQRFFTTVNGGVYAYASNLEEGETIEGDYINSITHGNFDGGRNDNMADQISSVIDGHDGTYWIVFELFGRIIKVTHAGAVTTLAGYTTDRSKLGLGYREIDANADESTIAPFLLQVGTIVSPTFGDLRGINKGCWDLTDSTPGNSLLVANPIDHTVCKITGLVSGPVTMFRIVGQDSGLGGVQVNIADNGGFVDGPATEFSSGSSVATFNGTVTGSVLTVNSGFAGTLSPGCPLSWLGAGNLNTTTGNMVISNRAGSGNGSTWNVNFASSGGAQSMTASQPVALMAGPYHVIMTDGIVGPDPVGTLYIADYQNSAVRRVAFSGGKWTAVTTLLGNQTGAIRWPATGPTVGGPVGAITVISTAFAISSATWTGGQLTLNFGSAVVQPGVDSQYGTIQVGWVPSIAGLTNAGSGGGAAVTGNFSVASVSGGGTSAVLTAPAGAGVITTLGTSISFTGSISPGGIIGQFGSVGLLNVTAIASSVLNAGAIITGPGVAAGTYIVEIAPQTGTTGGVGLYHVSVSQTVASSPSMTASAGLVFYADDVYLPPSATPRPLGGAHPAYCPLPQNLAINSTGKLIINNSWILSASQVDLAAATIVYITQWNCTVQNTRLLPNGTRGTGVDAINFQSPWIQMDVDSGVSGVVSSLGCIGPRDDIIMLSANGAVRGTYYWRTSSTGVPIAGGGHMGTNDPNRQQPVPIGRAGGGHYPWSIGISRHQGRMLTNGLSDNSLNSWRIINPAIGDFFTDSNSNLNVDGAALARGYVCMLNGSLVSTIYSGIVMPLPRDQRPGISSTHGESLRSQLGLPGQADTIDGVQALNPTDAGLTTFLQAGAGSSMPWPELTGDDLKDVIYAIRRTSVQGSLPAGTTGGGFTAVTPLVQRLPYETDVTAPIISGVSAARTGGGATTILVTWTTNKPCWCIVAAGFASAHGTIAPYHLYAREPYVAGAGNPSYGTSHSATIQCYLDVLTYVAVIAKDIPGNNAISAEQTVAA